MMLSTLLSGSLWRYVFAGSAVGAAAPVANLYSLAMSGDVSGGLSRFTSDPVLLATAALPIVVGYVGYRVGRRALRLRQRIDDLQRVALRDGLTGVGNRLALEQALETRLAEWAPACAVLLLDLDRFKFVNDTMGHEAGDALLQALTQRFMRVVDGVGEVYRLGGDEFVILLDGCADPQAVEPICLALEKEASTAFDLAKGRVVTGASIGVTFAGMSADDDIDAVLKRADLALYRAKGIYGSSHAFYDPDMAAEALRHFEIERDLARALSDDELFLEYQPIIGVKSGNVRSLEALLRWRHPTRGVISPELFVPLAERTGMILAIGKWVVQKACSEAVKWPAPIGVGVNVSGDQFKDRSFVAYILSCLSETGLSPGRLTIEVTEAVFSLDIDLVCESLAELRAAGVRIALDDFGTGFSSINNLKRFPLDQLKIDRSFAREMLHTTRDARLVDLIRLLSEAFQIDAIIEGIETRSQLDFVRSLGIAEAQGFLISRPVAAERVPELLTPEGCLFAAAS